jgi:outer membrane protein OmpA-like peptidoglycan-associated protein
VLGFQACIPNQLKIGLNNIKQRPMKKFILHLMVMMIAGVSFAQDQKMAHDRYTVSGGLLGAMNFSKFVMDGQNPADISYDPKVGWAAGGWVNIPLGRAFSVEPEVMYSYQVYRAENSNAILQDGNINFVSIPVLLKLHLGEAFAITAGPQFDLLLDVTDDRSAAVKEDLKSTSIGINGGFEVFPHGRAVIFGRYLYGLDNMDNRENADENTEYNNSNFQVGVKLRLFGKFIPADTDADGIPDENDNCPVEAGFERYSGCPIPDSDADGLNDETDKCPNEAGFERYMGCPIPDTDGDGLNDENDKCISQAGTAKYMGCPVPDTDGDGLNDEMDKCPTQKGLKQFEGCADTDGDGIIDNNDKCPTQAGVAAYQGCPIPDKDMDGVLDPDDKCPDIKGPADNGGCPKIENAKFNTQRIQFVTGSSTLTAASKTMIKEGAKLLNSDDFKNLKVEVRGHTDDVGKDESNMRLSQNRANAVMAELVKNGVASSRITAVGFGETMPIADNKTSAGRAQNRRVAFDVRQ